MEVTLSHIILTVCWIISALVEGARDSHFFHNRNTSTNPDKQNIHWLFTVERFIVWLLIIKIYSFHSSILNTGIFGFSLILIFSFFHNGVYYKIRHQLDNNVYPKGWWDSSVTSESALELNAVSRTFLAVTGFIGLIATYFLN